MTHRRFEGKNVIVTGAGQGIGLAIAERFAGEGADVMLVGRRREPLEALVGQIETHGGAAWLHAADVSDSSAVDAAVAAAHERWGRIDVLVNNAGIDSRMYQLAVRPQSTVRSMPVIADASSEARKAHAAAISSGRTRRRNGTRSNRWAR